MAAAQNVSAARKMAVQRALLRGLRGAGEAGFTFKAPCSICADAEGQIFTPPIALFAMSSLTNKEGDGFCYWSLLFACPEQF